MAPWKIILLLLGICIWSCNAIVNLTWTAEKDMLTLKCKTRPLIWSVQFLSPAGKEIAYCQIPFPSPNCYTTDESYITVNQDTTTNTTILTYKGISSSLNGQWKCIYGNNVDLDVVNVTIRVKDTSMEDTKDENCFEEFYAWTMLGFTMTIVITLLYNTVYFLTGRKSGGCFFGHNFFVYDCLCVPFSNVPTVDVKQPNDSVSTGTNSSLILHCTFKSTLPVKSFYWRKDDGKSKTTIACKTNKYKEMTTSTPSLTILNVDQSDEGSYTCFATNRVGTGQSTTIKLYVKEENESSPVLVCDSKHDTSLVEDSNNKNESSLVPVSDSKKKVIIAILLSVIVVVFPVCVGFIAKDCKYKEYFIIYGIFKALAMLIFSYNLVTHYVKDYKLMENKDDYSPAPKSPKEPNESAELLEDTSKSTEDENSSQPDEPITDKKFQDDEEPNESTELLKDTPKSTEDSYPDSNHAADAV